MTLQKKADVAWWVLALSFWAEILVLTLTTWWLHPDGREPSITIWLIRIVPLLCFLWGMQRRNLRQLAWLCFVCLLYFMNAVVDAMSPLGLWIDSVEVVLTVSLFVSAMLTIRWQAQAWRLAASTETTQV